MSHSLSKIWIHAIWSDKDRVSLINDKLEKPLYHFMYDEFNKMNCPAKIINGMRDHVHVLFLLDPQKSLMDVVKQIKGSSSYHINHNDMIKAKFSWETGYAAYSVGESLLNQTFLYIQHQKEHHQSRSFQEEYEEFYKLYGFTDKGE